VPVEPGLVLRTSYSAMMILWSLVAVERSLRLFQGHPGDRGPMERGRPSAHRCRRGLGSGTDATSMRVNNVYAFVD